MVFARPEALWLLPLLVLLALVLGRRADLPAFLRVVLLLALGLALARPVVPGEPPSHRVVLLEAGAEMGTDAELFAVAEAALKGGEATQRTLVLYAGGFSRMALEGGFEAFQAAREALPPGQDPEAGLDFAASLVSLEEAGHIHWIGEGRARRGAAEAALERIAAERRLGLSFAPRAMTPGPFGLLGIDVATAAPVGTSLPVLLRFESAAAARLQDLRFEGPQGQKGRFEPLVAAEAKAAASRGDGVLLRAFVGLESEGENRFQIRGQVGEAELAFEVAILGTAPLRVAVVEDPEAPSSREALAAALGVGVNAIAMRPEELETRDLAGIDGMIWVDLPARLLSEASLSRIEAELSQGLGLFVTGGQRSFGPGGYAQSAIADWLPVRFLQREERRDPSASLVIIIDTSGSMGGGRIELAKEVARLALRRLEPHDKAGIVEFHGAKRWAAPLQSAGNQVDLQRALNRLQAGGGTVILPAIQEAYYGLLNAKTRTRHVLVLTDGGVESGDFEGLIRRMADDGMTLSTVLVGGSGAYSSFLVSLAQWGRGRFYHCPDRFHLPEVLVKQPESSLLAPWIEAKTPLLAGDAVGPYAALNFAEGTEVFGHLEWEAKPFAEVALRAANGRPLLVRGQYGLGRVAVLAHEVAGNSTGTLAADPEYARTLALTLREVMTRPRSERTELLARSAFGGVVVSVNPGRPVQSEMSVRIELRDEAGELLASGAAPVADAQVGGEGLWFGGIEGPKTLRLSASTEALGTIAEGLWHQNDQALLRASLPRNDLQAQIAKRFAGDLRAPRTPGEERWPLFVLIAFGASLGMWLLRRWPRTTATVLLFLACVTPNSLSAQVPPTPVRVAPLRVVLQGNEPPKKANPGPDDEAIRPFPAELEPLLVGALADPLSDGGAAEELCQKLRLAQGELSSLIERLKPSAKDERSAALLLVRAAAEEGQLALASETLSRLDLKGDRALLSLAGRLHEWLGKNEQALESFEAWRALATEPEEAVAAHVRKASLLFTKPGQKDLALLELDRGLALFGGDPRLAWSFAYFAALHGAPERLLDATPPAEDPRERFDQHLFQGTARLSAKRFADAEASFRAALALSPLPRDRRFAAERVIAAARAGGRLSELAEEWRKTQDLEPEVRDALIALLRELERPAEAFQLLLAAGQSPVDLPRDAQREVIALGLESGREDEVLRIYADLIAREPRRLSFCTGLSLLHLLRGRRGEAEAVWRAAGERLRGDPKRLAVAEGALSVGLMDVARSEAEAVLAETSTRRADALLFLAELERRAGDEFLFLERMTTLKQEFQNDIVVLARVVESYERARKTDEARQLLEEIAKGSTAEDLRMRLAWTLEEAKDIDGAIDCWLGLWRETRIEARARQAVDRLLDLGSRHARLAEIAIDLEKTLQAGLGGARELGFLVRIYERAGDSVAAIEILREFGPKLGRGEIELSREMARVYQQCDDYRSYEETLRKLIAIDPENADDYRQQIALGALERGRGRLARKVLGELIDSAVDPRSALEFSAGVFAMVQLPKAAARAYGQVLAQWPERIETHLLRANVLRDSGRSQEATYGFLRLLEEAPEDDLFTIAVDGVLNLGGQGGAYRVAQRRVLERMMQKPNKGYLYQLAADLAEELKEPARQFQLTEWFALIAGERRSSVLRELMDLSAQKNDSEALLRYGRSLLAIGEVMPPQVFLDLGEALVRTGDLQTAARVFARAASGGDFVQTQRRIAEAYEKRELFSESERALREALIASPDDAELLLDAALAAQKAGAPERAAEDLNGLVQLIARQSPSRVGTNAASSTRLIKTIFGLRRISVSGSRNQNQDVYGRLGTKLFEALQGFADGRALATAEALLSEEIDLLREGEALSDKPAENPRAYRLIQMGRSVALARSDYAGADRIDELLLKTWPKAKDEGRIAVQERLEKGRFRDAAALSTRFGLRDEEGFAELRRWRFLNAMNRESVESEQETLSGEKLLELLPALRLAGEFDRARELLTSYGTRSGREPAAVLLTLFPVVQEELGNEAAEPYLVKAVERVAQAKKPGGDLITLGQRLRAAWPILSEGAMTRIRQLLGDAKARAEGPTLVEWQEFAERHKDLLNFEAEAPVADLVAALKAQLEQRSANGYTLMNTFMTVPYEHQPEMLPILRTHASKLQASSLISAIARAPERIHPDTHDFFLEIVRKDIGKLSPQTFNWIPRQLGSSTQNRSLARGILDELAKARPDSLQILVERWRIGLQDEDESVRRQSMAAAEQWLQARERATSWTTEEDGLVQQLINGSIKDLEAPAIAMVERAAAQETANPSLYLALALARRRAGALQEAVALIERARAAGDRSPQGLSQLRSLKKRLGAEGAAYRLNVQATEENPEAQGWTFLQLAREAASLCRPSDARRWMDRARPASDEGMALSLALHHGEFPAAKRALRALAEGRGFGDSRFAAQPFTADGPLSELMAPVPSFIGRFQALKDCVFLQCATQPLLREELLSAASARQSDGALSIDDLSLSVAWLLLEADEQAAIQRLQETFAGENDPSTADCLQVLLLGSREGKPLPSELMPALRRIERIALSVGPDKTGEQLGQIARIYAAAGAQEDARRLFHGFRAGWTRAAEPDFSEFFISSGAVSMSTISAVRIGGIDVGENRGDQSAWTEAWIDTFHEAERPLRRLALLREREASLARPPSVPALVSLLKGYAALGNTADVERLSEELQDRLAEVLLDESVPLPEQDAALKAMIEWTATQGDEDSLEALFPLGPRAKRFAYATRSLPKAEGLRAFATLHALWKQHLEAVFADGELPATEAASAWLDFAKWTKTASDPDRLRRLLEREELKIKPGQHEDATAILEIIALWRGVGEEATATAIEVEALQMGIVDEDRLLSLIELVQENEGLAAGRALLATQIAERPRGDWIARAVLLARDAGDATEATRLLDLLKQQHPLSPRLKDL